MQAFEAFTWYGWRSLDDIELNLYNEILCLFHAVDLILLYFI